MSRLASFGMFFAAVTWGADERWLMHASLFTGVAVDTFAARELSEYLNPDASGEPGVRGVLGFQFAYLLAGGLASQNGNNLWLFGHTANGANSREVDCQRLPDLPVCRQSLTIPRAGSLGRQAMFMIRNASTLEAGAGLRWEFYGLQRHSEVPANLYVKGEIGFVSQKTPGAGIAGQAGIRLGAVIICGPFRDSYFEAGFGRSSLYTFHPGRRLTVHARLQRRLPMPIRGLLAPSLFIQLSVDSDLGRGADSIQTLLGVDFDLGSRLSR